jgi:hypothetical protein
LNTGTATSLPSGVFVKYMIQVADIRPIATCTSNLPRAETPFVLRRDSFR